MAEGKVETSSLQEAVEADDLQQVKDIIRRKEYIAADLKNALFFACGSGKANCAALILEAGISPDIHNNDEFTPLTLAARGGHATVIEVLLRWDCNVALTGGPLNNTPLHYTANEGYTDCTRILVEAGSDINARNSRSDTPLILASSNGHLSLIKYLLEKHASVRRRGYHERTALHCATENGHLEICRLLLEAKADLEEEDTFGNTPLICSAEKGFIDVLKLFLTHGCDINRMSHSAATALHLAAQHGDLEICRLLLNNHAEIDAQDIRRFTPLMMAALNGHDHIIAFLHERKCNINMVAYNKRSALHLAAERGNLKCCRVLLKAGAHIDAQDSLGCSPIYNAAIKGNSSVVQFLIQNGADLTKLPNNGNSLLHYAASGGSIECCEELIKAGFDINAQNRDDAGSDPNYRGLHGMTALNEAVFYNSPQLVALLLEYGANADVEDDAGTLPLWFAVDGFSNETVKLLLNVNCKYNVQSSLSTYCGPCNAIEHAVHKRKEQVIAWLVSAYCEDAINILHHHVAKLEKMTNLDTKTLHLVKKLISCPCSLLEHCRKDIRKTLGKGTSVPEKIQSLNLPKTLKRYLNYSDMESENDTGKSRYLL
ncbi:hypothetical protein KUTeg_012888, partial [Tegillarca granosa]